MIIQEVAMLFHFGPEKNASACICSRSQSFLNNEAGIPAWNDVDNDVYVDSYKPGADDFKGNGEDHHEDPLGPNPSHEPAAIKSQ